MERLRGILLLLCFLSSSEVCWGQPSVTAVVAPNRTVAVELKVTLACTVYYTVGTSSPTLAIVKGDGNTPTFMDPPMFTSEESGVVMLQQAISSAQFNHSGEYLCNVSVGADSSTTPFQLTVRDEFAFVKTPTSINISLGSSGLLACMPNNDIEEDWYKNGTMLVPNSRVAIGTSQVTITSVVYGDIGVYTCQAVYQNVVYQASARIDITTYSPLEAAGVFGFGFVSTSDQTTVTCPIEGVPGPKRITWFSPSGSTVTDLAALQGQLGPYINEDGELVLTRARPEDSGIYNCTATDVTGSSAYKEFNIDVVESGPLIWTMWYLILVYCVVGVILVILLGLLIWFIVAMSDACIVKFTKIVREKKHVPRPQPRRSILKETPLDLPMYDPAKH